MTRAVKPTTNVSLSSPQSMVCLFFVESVCKEGQTTACHVMVELTLADWVVVYIWSCSCGAFTLLDVLISFRHYFAEYLDSGGNVALYFSVK